MPLLALRDTLRCREFTSAFEANRIRLLSAAYHDSSHGPRCTRGHNQLALGEATAQSNGRDEPPFGVAERGQQDSRPIGFLSSASPYSLAAMKSTTFDSDCICLTILPTSSLGSFVWERRMR
jgi:hypothetical protein